MHDFSLIFCENTNLFGSSPNFWAAHRDAKTKCLPSHSITPRFGFPGINTPFPVTNVLKQNP